MDKKLVNQICVVACAAFVCLHIVLQITILSLMGQSLHNHFMRVSNSSSTYCNNNNTVNGNWSSVAWGSGQQLSNPELWLTFYNCSPKVVIHENSSVYLSTCEDNIDIVDLRVWHSGHPTVAGVTLNVNSFESMCAGLLVRKRFKSS